MSPRLVSHLLKNPLPKTWDQGVLSVTKPSILWDRQSSDGRLGHDAVVVTLSSIGTASTVVGGVVTTVLGVRRLTHKTGRIRDRIHLDLALLEALPQQSRAREGLVAHIDDTVDELVRLQAKQLSQKYDPYGVAWVVIFLGLTIGLGVWAYIAHFHLAVEVVMWALTGFLALVTVAGFFAAKGSDDKKDDERESTTES